MYRLEWTKDSDLATWIMVQIYDYISDDTCPKREYFRLMLSDVFLFCLCYNNEQLCGGFFVILKDKEAEIHTCMLPIAKGKAKDFGDLILAEIFKVTDAERITSYAPIDNPLAKRLALRCGLKYTGNGSPMMKKGKLVPVENFAIERADLCQL